MDENESKQNDFEQEPEMFFDKKESPNAIDTEDIFEDDNEDQAEQEIETLEEPQTILDKDDSHNASDIDDVIEDITDQIESRADKDYSHQIKADLNHETVLAQSEADKDQSVVEQDNNETVGEHYEVYLLMMF